MNKSFFYFLIALVIAACSSNEEANDQLTSKRKKAGKGIHFENLTVEEARKKAEAEDKLIFIDFYADWCGPCKQMHKNVFNQEEIGRYFDKEYIALKIDVEDDSYGKKVANDFKIQALPTLGFFHPDGTLMGWQATYVSPMEFLRIARDAVDKKNQ